MEQSKIDWAGFGACAAIIIVVSLPILLIGVLKSVSLVKSLRADA